MIEGWNNLMHYRGTRHAKVLRQLVRQMCEAERDRISADRAQAVTECTANFAAECHEGRAALRAKLADLEGRRIRISGKIRMAATDGDHVLYDTGHAEMDELDRIISKAYADARRLARVRQAYYEADMADIRNQYQAETQALLEHTRMLFDTLHKESAEEAERTRAECIAAAKATALTRPETSKINAKNTNNHE
jgi:hypothetical protein